MTLYYDRTMVVSGGDNSQQNDASSGFSERVHQFQFFIHFQRRFLVWSGMEAVCSSGSCLKTEDTFGAHLRHKMIEFDLVRFVWKFVSNRKCRI